jgi:aspartate/methionine/tyrosine aminotransferase
MKFQISPHIEKVHFPPISEVREWISGRGFPPERPLIDLCQAVPDCPPAMGLTNYLSRIVNDPVVCRYTPDEGLLEVREAIGRWYGRLYGSPLDPAALCLTVGASQAFWLAMTVLCREGDEVVVQLPAYFDHVMALEILGLRPVYAPFDEASGGIPDPEVVARLITPRTKAILLVTPSNPTGVVTPPEILGELCDLARQRGIALVLDETYNTFIPGGERLHDLFADSRWGDHLLHIASFGKTFSLTGYRAGLLAASPDFIRHALKVQDTMAVCQPRITQLAVGFAVEHLDNWVAVNRETMILRHDLFRTALAESGSPFKLSASGPFFGWVRHPFAGRTGREVARFLADEANILCLPGEVFGPGLGDYLRFAFGNIREGEIPAAVARLAGSNFEF